MIAGVLAGCLIAVGWWLLGDDGGRRLQSLTRGSSEPAPTAAPTAARSQWGLMRRRNPSSTADAVAFDLELVAICLQAGLPTDRAISLAAAAGTQSTGLDRLGRSLALGEVDEVDPQLAAVSRLVRFSRSTGVALAPLLRGLAHDMRRAEHRRRQIAAARLGVQLVVPLGLCILPAFVLLGVLPVVLSLIDDLSVLFA